MRELLYIITNKCNLNCFYCFCSYVDKSYIKGNIKNYLTNSFISKLREAGIEKVSITGGEPLLHQDIFRIIRALSDNKIASHISTNGTLLNGKNICALMESGLSSISVSIGMDKFDKIRKEYQLVENNLINILRYNTRQINLSLNVVVTKKNFNKIPEHFNLWKKRGISKIRYLPIYINPSSEYFMGHSLDTLNTLEKMNLLNILKKLSKYSNYYESFANWLSSNNRQYFVDLEHDCITLTWEGKYVLSPNKIECVVGEYSDDLQDISIRTKQLKKEPSFYTCCQFVEKDVNDNN